MQTIISNSLVVFCTKSLRTKKLKQRQETVFENFIVKVTDLVVKVEKQSPG